MLHSKTSKETRNGWKEFYIYSVRRPYQSSEELNLNWSSSPGTDCGQAKRRVSGQNPTAKKKKTYKSHRFITYRSKKPPKANATLDKMQLEHLLVLCSGSEGSDFRVSIVASRYASGRSRAYVVDTDTDKLSIFNKEPIVTGGQIFGGLNVSRGILFRGAYCVGAILFRGLLF